MLNRLQAGAGTYACGGYLAGLGSLQRSEICTALLFSRLERKMRMVDALREEASENWNQTFYLLYFRTLGDRRNQEAYLSLARRVPYKVVLRERLAPRAVEAMFFGASGLLDALSARRVHARPGARLRIPGGQIRHRTAGCRGLGTGRRYAPPTIPYCVWHRRPSSSYRTNS